MIAVSLTKEELEYILDKLKVSSNKKLYDKLWSIKFSKIQQER